MKKSLSLLFALTGWFAVITQYVLMLNNSTFSVLRSSFNFLSFFTILTNTAVAIYFTAQLLNNKQSNKPGLLTALTIYITVVGAVYQIMLRHLWAPEGMQKLVDELLHSIMPLCTIFYWYAYENKSEVNYRQITSWLVYPFVYLIWILARGNYTGFYPYPFMDVTTLGLGSVLLNALVLVVVFTGLSALVVKLGKLLSVQKRESK